MTCEHCEAAQTNPDYAGLQTSCRACEIRQVARCPKVIRQRHLAEIQRKRGEAAMQAYRLEVRAEYDRIAELREKA